MNYLLIALPVVLLAAFLGVWLNLRRTWRRRLDEEDFAGTQDDLDQLLAMKGKLTEEEYRRVRQAVVGKITASAPGRQPLSKEVNLAALEQELALRKAHRIAGGGGEKQDGQE